MRISPISVQNPFGAYTAQAEKTATSPEKNDVVTLSDEGKKMQAKASENTSSLISTLDNFMDGAGKDGVITLDEIRNYGEKNLTTAEGILAETLEQLGIPSDSNITIKTDENGTVKVDSDLLAQENEKLEAALNEHADFQQAYTKASSSQTFIDAAEKHMEFAQAYAKNPKAAVAQFGISSSSSGGFVLQYAQKQASLLFQDTLSLSG